MIDLRTRLLLAIGGAVLLVALIIGGIFIGKKVNNGTEEIVTETPATEEISEGQPIAVDETPVIDIPITPAPIPQTTEEKQALYVRQLSRDFIERFLSFSNKNNDKHLVDVESSVTAIMLEWVKLQTTSGMSGTVSQNTKVISTSLNSIEGDSASVSIGVQQIIKDDSGTKAVYKNGRVELLRIGGVWKIDGLFWEE